MKMLSYRKSFIRGFCKEANIASVVRDLATKGPGTVASNALVTATLTPTRNPITRWLQCKVAPFAIHPTVNKAVDKLNERFIKPPTSYR